MATEMESGRKATRNHIDRDKGLQGTTSIGTRCYNEPHQLGQEATGNHINQDKMLQ